MYAAPQVQDDSAIASPQLLDPTLLKAARLLYRAYKEVHPDGIQRPLGVAIDRFTHRGQLIFTQKPALLLTECLVPFDQLEAGLY